MPARGYCVGNGGRNALKEADLLKKWADLPVSRGLRRDGAENRGF
jgi:hypothetical protein